MGEGTWRVKNEGTQPTHVCSSLSCPPLAHAKRVPQPRAGSLHFRSGYLDKGCPETRLAPKSEFFRQIPDFVSPSLSAERSEDHRALRCSQSQQIGCVLQ